MKVCPNCQTKYPEDSNFCPQETCATPEGPRRLEIISEAPASRYEMEGQIGGRRSGEVFRARDRQTGATVAYKRVTRAVLTSPAVVERSQRELKQLQRAQSPRLAKILDFGKEPDGQLFVVSELADGQTLAQVVAASGPFSLDRAKKIAAQIGEALLEGQKVGVVHHDLAPKNVLVGAGDQVKLINFVAPVPVTETVFGVPEYLSPEQAEGKLVDQRSNTYSLGGILLFMLTGQPPVEGASAGAVLEQVMKGAPVPPSLRVQGLNAEIDRVIGKAMDKSPNRRPLTMRQFLTDVAGMMAVAPQTADPARGVGFAKTMMFAGGSPEAQKLVNQALAARAEANGAGAPPPGGAGPNATAPIAMIASEARGVERFAGDAAAGRASRREPKGRGRVGPTAQRSPPRWSRCRRQGGFRAPSRGQNDLDSGAQATPPPVAPAPAAACSGRRAQAAPKPTGAAAFRETLWFKQGDVDQMVADARAKLDASRAKSGPGAAGPCAGARGGRRGGGGEAARGSLPRRRHGLGGRSQEVLASLWRHQHRASHRRRRRPRRPDERRRNDGRDRRRQADRHHHRRGGGGAGGGRRDVPGVSRQARRAERGRADAGRRFRRSRRRLARHLRAGPGCRRADAACSGSGPCGSGRGARRRG